MRVYWKCPRCGKKNSYVVEVGEGGKLEHAVSREKILCVACGLARFGREHDVAKNREMRADIERYLQGRRRK